MARNEEWAHAVHKAEEAEQRLGQRVKGLQVEEEGQHHLPTEEGLSHVFPTYTPPPDPDAPELGC